MARLKTVGPELAIAGAGLLLAPTLNAYGLDLASSALIYGLLAISLDLIWGYGGLLDLGPAMTFGLGAYAWTLAVIHLPAPGGVYIAFALAVLCPAAFAAIIGFVSFWVKTTPVYFALLTIAASLILNEVVVLLYHLTGGTGGLTGATNLSLFGVVPLSSSHAYYVFLVLVVAAVIWLARSATRSASGTVVQAIRDNERRAETLGYNPVLYKTVLFAAASGVAGLAGALFVPLKTIASPDDFGITLSITVFVWVAIGGARTILGPFFAAVVLSVLQSLLSDVLKNSYLFIVGLLFIVIVVAAPDGIAGLLTKRRRRTPVAVAAVEEIPR